MPFGPGCVGQRSHGSAAGRDQRRKRNPFGLTRTGFPGPFRDAGSLAADLSGFFWRRIRRNGINAEFLANMSKAFRIGETTIGHHRTQLSKSRLGEE